MNAVTVRRVVMTGLVYVGAILALLVATIPVRGLWVRTIVFAIGGAYGGALAGRVWGWSRIPTEEVEAE